MLANPVDRRTWSDRPVRAGIAWPSSSGDDAVDRTVSTDQGFEVLTVAVFDIAARQDYGVARGIVKELAAVPNIPLAEAWLRVLRHLGPTGLKEFLAPDEEARWKRAVETKMGEVEGRELPTEVAWSLLAQVLAESRLRTAKNNLRRWLRLLQE